MLLAELETIVHSRTVCAQSVPRWSAHMLEIV